MTDTVLVYRGRPITDLTKDELVDAMTWAFQEIEYQRERANRFLNAAALAEPEPPRRCIYSPAQIAECGGPCEQGPEHCDCGELCVTEPEPEGPTDEELILTYAFAVAEAVNAMCKPLKPEDYKYAQLAGLRAVLARWGNHPESPDSSTLQPVPVSERLPGPGDCDAEGRCWLCGKVEGDWRLINPSKSGVPQLKYCFTHWLPAHALPQPS